MEVQRALSDLAEVRDRLAHLQRFHGYSAYAAAASGVFAFIAGYLQLQVAAMPRTVEEERAYIVIWLTCLAAALAINYGAVFAWLWRNRGPRAQSQFRSAALTIAPSILLGGTLSVALVDHAAYTLLPGTWFACYSIGLFASRDMLPKRTMIVTLAFAALALVFLLTPLEAVALAWWVMPLGFGCGQIGIGYLMRHDEARR
jgi:hypothetical protein